MAKARNVKEVIIELALSERVAAAGGICLKVQVIGGRGFFDRLVVLPGGRIIFCELKRPRGGRISPHQKQYIDTFKALGVVDVFVVKTIADINKILRQER